MRRIVGITAAVCIAALAAMLWWQSGPGPGAPPASSGIDSPAPAPVAATAERADHLGELKRSRALDGAATGVLEFAAARTGYRGRVLATSGTPVPGIGVRLLRASPDIALPAGLDPFTRMPVAPQLEAARGVTDQDGRFALMDVLPRGLCVLRCDFPDLQRVPPAWRAGQGTMVPVQKTPAPGEVVDLGNIHLKAGAVLTGRVIGDDDQPVAGALVRAARLPPLPFAAVPIQRLRPDGVVIVTASARSGVLELPPWIAGVMALLPIATTATGTDGTFTLYGVDPGKDVVAVTAPGRDSLLLQGVTVQPEATTHLGELLLPDGCTAEVAVSAGDGEPVGGAEVVVAPLSLGVPVHIGERAGTTDRDGRVRIAGLPRGRARAAARRTAQDPWCIGPPGPADGSLRVELPATHALTLTILEPTGQPVRDPRLRLVSGAGNAGVVEFEMFGLLRGIDLARRLHRLDDGRLRIDDLAAGTWCVVTGAPGCATQSLDVELQEDTERTVQLHAARALQVRTVDASGAPVADATLYVQPRGGSRAQRVVNLPLPAGRTNRDGCCTVRDLPTGTTRITASHPRHGQVHAIVEGVPPDLLLQFAVPGTITGRLTDGGRAPAPGRWLVVLQTRYEKTPRGAVPDLPQLMLPDLDGRFEFAALQPGRYRLTAQDSLADVGTIGGMIEYRARRKQIYPWNKAEVDLHGGEMVEVLLDAFIDAPAYDGPGAPITGTVTIDGLPGAGALVVGTSTRPERRVTSRVDRGGAFDLGYCPVGKLRVVVVPREVAESRLLEHLFSHQFARDIQVVDTRPQDLRIEVTTGAVGGQVRDQNGAPVEGCRIVVFDRGGNGRSSALRVARTDARGSFRFVGLPIGVFEVRAQKEGVGKAAATTVQVTAGTGAGELAIELLATARVKGRVEVAALPRRGRLTLVLHPVGGGEVIRGGGKANGAFELKDVPAGRYRVEVRVRGARGVYPAGELDVHAPATTGVVLVPRAQ